MRRLVSLAVILLFAIPFGTTLAGCSKGTATQFCNGQNAGVVVGQTVTLDLEPRLTGLSLNQGAIGGVSPPSAKDCKGDPSSANNVRYGSTDMNLVDIVPTTGRICAGVWNRNSGGGVQDYTTCIPNGRQGVAFVTASAEAVTSNAIPVYIHPIITSIVLGAASTNCTADPASNCYDGIRNGFCAAGAPANPTITAPSYTGNACISQNKTAQLAARSFATTTTVVLDPITGLPSINPITGLPVTVTANPNVSCQVGPLTFAAQDPSVVSIDQNGLATAAQPGSSIINASIAQNISTAGFFATCPPKSIVLSPQGTTTIPTTPLTVSQNMTQSLVATVVDIQNQPITNINLTYVSTAPTTIPAQGNTITPTFPGAASITALCQPPTCNTSPFNEIGLFGNGTPVFSNPVQINATGTANSTVLYIGSTNSQYIQTVDFTQNSQNAPLRLPYAPNSMVLSTDLTALYLGSANELMIVSASGNAVSLGREDTSAAGKVLAVSPDNGTIVITDATRNLTYLYLAGGGFSSQYGGVGTRAVWSPDSSTVYITTTDGRMLVHSTFTGWTSVALPNIATDATLTVPNAGVYLGNNPGAGTVTARTVCPVTLAGTGNFPTTTNTFFPLADTTSASAVRVAATNDGVHVLGASLTQFSDLTTNQKSGACPIAFTSALAAAPAFSGLAATGIVDVLPTSDSAFAFTTYTGTGGVVPQYAPGTKTLSNIALQKTASGTPVAPVRGVVASDNQTVYIGTSGDNIVHRLTRGAAGFSDTVVPVIPALPALNGPGTAVPDLLAQKPRRSNS